MNKHFHSFKRYFSLAFILFPLSCFAQKQQSYHLEVVNDKNIVIKTLDFIYPNEQQSFTILSSTPFVNTLSYKYVDLCLSNNNQVDYSYKNLVTKQFDEFSIIKPENAQIDEPRLHIEMSFPYFKKTNIGDCDIDTPFIQRFTIDSVLPFIIYEESFDITDIDNLKERYIVKIHAKKINVNHK